MKHISTFKNFVNESSPVFSEFMLEWTIPGKESNTLMSKSLKELIDYVSKHGITKYTIQGRRNNNWETLIS